ncbi:hypothetical protein [Pedobacter sp. Hv1]|uniref:hypothetical protein n=1 Tax=Pedobacter sp. Hv1 TaxID=1740090 RepID=UPI0006D8AFB3|nr:hypothetical protein [Pedobacter sp. Hv1]KQB98787.1 hypothetical protein AQF98_20810 [Pedobacter sp. Hv1]
MNTIEEQLWNYIDGHCEPAEKLAIETQLAIDHQFYSTYQELLAVHHELNKLDFEEPSMSFTRNVMEQVKLELPPVALKTKVDRRIVYAFATLFIIPLLSIFIYAIAKSDLSLSSNMPKINFAFDVHKLITPLSVQLFIIVDVVLVLVYLDGYLRKGKTATQKKGG